MLTGRGSRTGRLGPGPLSRLCWEQRFHSWEAASPRWALPWPPCLNSSLPYFLFPLTPFPALAYLARYIFYLFSLFITWMVNLVLFAAVCRQCLESAPAQGRYSVHTRSMNAEDGAWHVTGTWCGSDRKAPFLAAVTTVSPGVIHGDARRQLR